MTVTVTLQDGDTDKYMRFGDTYIKHNDGTLDVVRDGAKEPHSYAPGVWTNVQGNAAATGFCNVRCPRDLEVLLILADVDLGRG
jgi:hypothetical protein